MGLQKKMQPRKSKKSVLVISKKKSKKNSFSKYTLLSSKKTAQLKNILGTLQKVNQAILKEPTRQKLITQICKILIENQKYLYAWIALFDGFGKFDIFAQAGMGKRFKLMIQHLRESHYPPCISKILKLQKSILTRNPFSNCPKCPLDLHYHNRKHYCFPLIHQKITYGIMVISLPAGMTICREEKRNLKEIAENLGFALHKISVKQTCSKTETALHSTEEQLQNLFKTMVEGIALFEVQYNVQGKPTDYILRNANPAFSKILNLSPAEISGKKSGFFLNKGIPPHLKTYIRVAEKGKSINFEDYYQVIDKYFLVSVFSPKKGWFITVLNDVTEKKKLEIALTEKEERLRLALEAANQGFWEWRLENKAIQVSPNYFTMLGYTQPKSTLITLETLEKSIHPQDKNSSFTTIIKHIQKKFRSFEMEFRLQNRVGNWQWLLVRGKVIERNKHNEPIRITGTYLNITERKQTEELNRIQRDLAAALSAISNFKEAMQVCIESAMKIPGIDSGGIYLVDENGGLELVVHKGLSPQFIKESSYYSITSPQTHLVMTGKPHYCYYPDLQLPKGKKAQYEYLRAITIIPISYKNKVFGCFNLASHSQNEIPPFIREVLEAIAAQVGNTILRIKAQTEQSRSEKRYRSIYNQSPIGIVLYSADGKLLNVNQACLDIFGVSSFTNVEKLNLFEIPGFTREAKAKLLNGKPFRSIQTFNFKQAAAFGIRQTKKSGILFLDIQIIPLGIPAQESLTGYLVQIQDITERKLAEDALQEAKIRFESVIENTPQVAIQGFNREGIICHWNKACETFYGFKSEEVIGHHFRDNFLPGEAGDAFEKVLNQIYETGQAISPQEWEVTTKDGRKLWVYSSTFPIFEQGKVSEVFCMDVDITSRKQTEEELLRAKEQAEETNLKLEQAIKNANDLARQAAIADAAKSQFLANVSHEIRTPMNSIIGFAEMLLDSELSVEQRNSVETILNSTETLMSLINDILDLSKVEAGQIELEKIPMNLENLVSDVCELVRGKIEKKPIEILCDFGMTPIQIIGDPTRLRQILLNLLGNAVKFTHAGEIVTTLSLLHEDNKKLNIQFAVRDTGIGIPQDKIKTIFEPFTQADGSTSRVYGGTGLGLTISQKLVQLMGGTLTVQTRVGEGSTFIFNIWVEKPSAEAKIESPAEINMDLHNLRILVIDDNPTAIRIMQTLTTQLGMQCTSATTFTEALQYLEQASFDILLTDLHLPDMDAPKLRKYALKRSNKNPTQIIAVSPHPFREKYQNQCSHFDGILVKPVRRTSFAALIQSLIHSEQSEALAQKPYLPSDSKPASAKILLAEDNKSNQEIITKMLERMGHQVDIASDGYEVLLLTEKNQYDLIFMDMQMPKMGGLEATHILRQKGSTLPIIALTANAMKGDRERCLSAGMNDYISKPIKRDTVLDVLNRYTGIKPISDTPETLRILLVGKDETYLQSMYEAFHQAFPMSSCRMTTCSVEVGVLFGSFFPDLLVIDLQLSGLDTFAMINYLKSETRYSHTRIIAYNAQNMNKIHIQTLRNMGVAVLLPKKIYTNKFIAMAKQLFSNAYSFHALECETDISLVESICQELGISTKDYYDILDIFLKNTPDKIRALKEALDAENKIKASDVAHSLKSSALSLRLHTVADPASRLEKLVQENKFSDTVTHFTTLQNAFEAIRLTMPPPGKNTQKEKATEETNSNTEASRRFFN